MIYLQLNFNLKKYIHFLELFHQKISCQKITDQIISGQEYSDRSLCITGLDSENFLV